MPPPDYFTHGPLQHCPACGGEFPYAGPRNPSLRFLCPLCRSPIIFHRTGDSTERKVPADPTCRLCGAPMVRRRGKFGEFWGCSEYKRAKCKGKPRFETQAVVEWDVKLVAWEPYTEKKWKWADPEKVARAKKQKQKEQRWKR